MKRILVVLLAISLLFATPSYGIVDWIRGDGTDSVKGTDNASDIDYDITNYLQDPLDRQLMNYIHGCSLTRTSVSVITVGIGEVVCANGAGTIKRMRQNTSTTTIDMAVAGVGGIDSGSAEKASTWYDAYAVADANATTFTAICAEQGTALSDATYYRYIGSFYNDSGSDIKEFVWSGNGKDPFILWPTPVSLTTTAVAAFTAQSCSTGMPSSSTLGLFGVNVGNTNNAAQLYMRPTGTTGTGITFGYSTSNSHTSNRGQVVCATDSSQSIDYYDSNVAAPTVGIRVDGFWLKR